MAGGVIGVDGIEAYQVFRASRRFSICLLRTSVSETLVRSA